MLIKRLQGPQEKRNGYYYEFDMHSKPVGEGGMGRVYKGFKVYEATGNRSVVAIKAMFDDLPTDVYERAEREASIRLRNDNLVEMLGFIIEKETEKYGLERNRYYVVSEFLNGVVLSELLSGNFKDADGIEIVAAKQLYTKYLIDKENTSVEIIKSILSGILALHDKGYIHRDIDPTNIMVTDKGNIKLIDFGIAKNVKSLGTIDKSLTTNGKFIGKAEYASPELVLGDVRNQGLPTDIYAIGILFYRLLVGKLPFTGSKYEVLQMQLHKKTPVKHIDNPYLRKIIKKATDKNRNNRYSSVAELRVEIDNAIAAGSGSFGKYLKYGAAIILASAACITAVFLFNHYQQPISGLTINKDTAIEKKIDDSYKKDAEKTIITPSPADYSKDFNKALAMLNSKNRKEAYEGLTIMKDLADKNHVPAIYELGVTYCPRNEIIGDMVESRRDVLGLSKMEPYLSADSSKLYLEKIKANKDIPIKALLVLGVDYWRMQKWAEGFDILTEAEERLSEGPVNNNIDKQSSDLKVKIKEYSDKCKEKLKERENKK